MPDQVSVTGGGHEVGPGPIQFSEQREQVFNKRTIKVSCSWRCPGTFSSSAAHLTPVSLILCSSGNNAQGESRAPCQLKKTFKGPETKSDLLDAYEICRPNLLNHFCLPHWRRTRKASFFLLLGIFTFALLYFYWFPHFLETEGKQKDSLSFECQKSWT